MAQCTRQTGLPKGHVHFKAPSLYESNAWVGIIPSKVPHGSEQVNDRHDISYRYLKNQTSGTLVFNAPVQAGTTTCACTTRTTTAAKSPRFRSAWRDFSYHLP